MQGHFINITLFHWNFILTPHLKYNQPKIGSYRYRLIDETLIESLIDDPFFFIIEILTKPSP